MKRRPLLDQADPALGSTAALAAKPVPMTVEQETRIGPPGEGPWLITALFLAGLILAWFGFTRLTSEQPPLSTSPAVNSLPSDQLAPTLEPAASVLIPPNPAASILIVANAEARDTVRPENADPAAILDSNAKERLVRRFYDEVLNQGHELAMPFLFAGQVTYQACGSRPTTFSAVEFSQSLLAEQGRFYGLTYTIEQVSVKGDRVGVGWSAEGRLIDPFAVEPNAGQKVTWSGLTVWQIANGKIVAGWSVDTGSLCRTE